MDNEHAREHGRALLHPCTYPNCGRSFSSSQNLKYHFMNNHRGNERARAKNKEETCHVCGKIVLRLQNHLENMHGEGSESVECEHCHRRCRNVRAYRSHVKRFHRVALGLPQLEFGCEECGKKFTTQNAQARHQKAVHIGIRHHCHLCEKSYVCPADLKSHVSAIHEGKKIPCRVCGVEFTRASDRNRHERTVHQFHAPNPLNMNS